MTSSVRAHADTFDGMRFCSVLPGHGVLQGHVLGSCERQSVGAVVMHQFWDAGKNTAALIQRVAQALAAFSLRHDDVYTTLTGPKNKK